MKILLKHFVVSFFTAKNRSKNRGFKNFYNIFIIRFFYAFSFIRNFLNNNNYTPERINSEKYFKKNISNESRFE